MSDKQKQISLNYNPVPTARLFHACPGEVKAILGPIGSGKSVACCWELYLRALSQEPYNGVRRTRFAIIRNTYPSLEASTIKTWTEWFPEVLDDGRTFFKLNRQRPMTGELNIVGADGIPIKMEIHFLALDKEEDIKKLKSVDLTGAWINEASEVPKAVWDMAQGRCDRFPPKHHGGCTWHGLIMDTNAPDEESDFYRIFEQEKPKGYFLFKQPPSVFLKQGLDKDAPPEYEPNYGQRKGIPKCENAENHNSGYDYWMRLVHGRDPYWIKVFLMGEYGVTRKGKPVFESQYSDSFHCSTAELNAYNGIPLLVGIDYGHAACVIAQMSPRGQLRFLDELYTDKVMGIKQFAQEMMLPLLRSRYRDMSYRAIGDPSGNSRAMTDEVTCMMELSSLGVPIEMARSNLLSPRLNSMRNLLTQIIDGQPRVIFSPRCKQLRAAMQAKYVYAKRSTSTGISYSEDPEKNHPYSDLADCSTYITMDIDGGGNYGNTGHQDQGHSMARPVKPGNWDKWD